MRRLMVLALLALVGFYVAWPAYSGWQIYSALTGGEPTVLAEKIDFPSVRRGLRPVVRERVESEAAGFAQRSGGSAPQLLSALQPMMPKMVDRVLGALVTPQGAIKIAQGTGSISERVGALVRKQFGNLGGALGPLGSLLQGGGGSGGSSLSGLKLPGGAGAVATALGGFLGSRQSERQPPAAVEPQAPLTSSGSASGVSADQADTAKSFGLSNIKSFGFNGPLAFEFGVAQDPESTRPDVFVEMGFRDFDWKIISVRPQI